MENEARKYKDEYLRICDLLKSKINNAIDNVATKKWLLPHIIFNFDNKISYNITWMLLKSIPWSFCSQIHQFYTKEFSSEWVKWEVCWIFWWHKPNSFDRLLRKRLQDSLLLSSKDNKFVEPTLPSPSS